MSLVSDRERESAAAALRRQYLYGRLSTEQLAERVELALRAPDRRALRTALRGLPSVWRDADEVRRLARSAKRRLVVALLRAGWAFASLVLLVAFAADALANGVSLLDLIVFGGAWVVITAFVWRAVRRA